MMAYLGVFILYHIEWPWFGKYLVHLWSGLKNAGIERSNLYWCFIFAEEKQCSSFGDGHRMGPNGKIIGGGEITLETKIKLLRAHVIR
jgi:hypothetical protein